MCSLHAAQGNKIKVSQQIPEILRTPTRVHIDALVKRVLISFPIPRGPALDVGCGTGEFMVELRHLGFDSVEGIDAQEYSVDIARQRCHVFGMKVVKSDLFEFRSKNCYDLVVAREILEHIPNDGQALCKLSSLLLGGGVSTDHNTRSTLLVWLL